MPHLFVAGKYYITGTQIHSHPRLCAKLGNGSNQYGNAPPHHLNGNLCREATNSGTELILALTCFVQ